jgi:mono/diheme cytochrome c family protein
MKKLFGIGFVLSGVAMAMSLSIFAKPFNSTYKVAKGSNLDKAACAVCHSSAKGGKLNAYGADIQSAMKAEGTKKLSAGILGKVEAKDSDGDGTKNIDEIKKDSNPGVK